jgi:hypothetical protein
LGENKYLCSKPEIFSGGVDRPPRQYIGGDWSFGRLAVLGVIVAQGSLVALSIYHMARCFLRDKIFDPLLVCEGLQLSPAQGGKVLFRRKKFRSDFQ